MNGQHPSRNAFTVPLYDTTGLTLTLANPYAQHASSNYYQAYVQAYSNPRPRTTADGYTLSSTYVPGTASGTRMETSTVLASPLRDQPSAQARSPPTVKPIRNHLTFGSWYQPGNSRCTRSGCQFTGSSKSVEIHMMDRHLIFPPWWKKQDDWDTDPSLRGKPITIQGTSLVLDTPEAIDAWIAERKKRFPTEEKVQQKKRKLEEAVARGQLTLEDIGIGTRKKRKQDRASVEGRRGGIRGKGRQAGRGRCQRALVQRNEPATEEVDNLLADAKVGCPREASPSLASTRDDDEAPEVVSSKAPTISPCAPKFDASHDKETTISLAYAPCSKRVPKPKEPQRNPFASRSTLLRNLLLPEIRITVSNLSQAIHFLVDNEFLRGVELRPGEAQERMIEVLGSSETLSSAQLPSPARTCEQRLDVDCHGKHLIPDR